MEPKRSISTYLVPSIADILFVTVLALLFFRPDLGLLNDGDTGYHVRAGEYILDTGAIPGSDIFSLHHPPLPWTAHEWLSELLMAAAHRALGLNGVVAGAALILAVTAALLYRHLKESGSSAPWGAAVTIFALAASQIHWLARPHLFSLFFMVLFHHLIDSWHQGRENRLHLLPPLMLAWVNLHGGYLGGFILIAAYLAGNAASLLRLGPGKRGAQLSRIKELLLAAAWCLAFTLANPYGYNILWFPIALVSDRYLMDNVVEFLSPNFHERLPFKYLLLSLIAVLSLSRKRLDESRLFIVVGFTYMALYSARYIPLFAIVTAPVICSAGNTARLGRFGRAVFKRSQRITEIDARSRGHLWAWGALAAVTAAGCTGLVEHRFDQAQKPVAACEFLMRERIDGNMFNSDEFGDYLIYRSYPAYRVFIDGRLDMYGSGRVREYSSVTGFEPGWEGILDKYRVTWIFFPTDSPFSRHLLAAPGWALIYRDKVASIFVKRVPEHRGLLSRYDGRPAGVAQKGEGLRETGG